VKLFSLVVFHYVWVMCLSHGCFSSETGVSVIQHDSAKAYTS